jgi:hypothetical protein
MCSVGSLEATNKIILNKCRSEPWIARNVFGKPTSIKYALLSIVVTMKIILNRHHTFPQKSSKATITPAPPLHAFLVSGISLRHVSEVSGKIY